MRPPKKALPTTAEERRSRVPEAIFVGSLTAAVALFGAGLTWWSSDRALKQSMYESCIKRVDEQETKLRDKAGTFLALRSEWLSKNINPKMRHEDYYQAGEKAIAAANDLSMHAPLELGLAAMVAADAIEQIMSAHTPEEIERVRNEIKKEEYDLLKFFFSQIDEFQNLRSGCKQAN